MSIKKNKKYVFENDLLQFEFLDKNYTNNIFEEFNETSKKLNLSSKINNLMSGKIINHSENQAATHTIIRGLNLRHTIENGLYNFNIKINSEFRSNWLNRLLLPTEQVDIVTLGIGGSFEGPKLLTEFLEQKKGTRFASIANYLNKHGWKKNEPWSLEVNKRTKLKLDVNKKYTVKELINNNLFNKNH